MSKEKTSIGYWLFLSILIIPAMGCGLINAPHYTTKVMGANGYLGFLTGAFFILPCIGAIYLLARRFPKLSIIEQGKVILGPVLGTVTGLIYLGFNLIILIVYTRDLANLVGAYFLDRTPILAITSIFVIIAAYAGSRGIETISRWACFVMLPALVAVLGLTLLGFQNFNHTYILPLTSPHWQDYFMGGVSSLDVYFLVGISAMSLPYLKKQVTYPRLAGIAILFLTFYFTLLSIGTIGKLGHEYMMRLAWPGLEFIRDIDLPFILIEQAGLLMLIVCLTLTIVGTSYLYYTIGLGASQLTGVMDYKRWVWMLFPVKMAMIMLPRGIIETKNVFDFTIRVGWMIIFVYPLLLWLTSIILNRRWENPDET